MHTPGRYLGKKTDAWKKKQQINPHQPVWCNTDDISVFLQKRFLQKFVEVYEICRKIMTLGNVYNYPMMFDAKNVMRVVHLQ